MSFTLEYKPDPSDVFLQGLPLFHIAANVSFTYAYNGATNVVVRDFNPTDVIQTLEDKELVRQKDPWVDVVIGTHNLRSKIIAKAYMKRNGIHMI